MSKKPKKFFYPEGGNLPIVSRDTTINQNPYKILPNGKIIPIYTKEQILSNTDNLSNTFGNKLPYGYDSVNLNTPVTPSIFTNKPLVPAPDAAKLFPDVFSKAYGGKIEKFAPDIEDYNYLKGVGSAGIQEYYAQGGNLMDYYTQQMNNNQQVASGLLGTVGGIAGSLIAPGIGTEIGSKLGEAAGSMFKDGGWIKGAINPAHKGYCTPMTKATCTPHRKAFAKRAKAHFKAEGGLLTEIPGSAGTHEQNPNQGVNIESYDSSVEGNETIDNNNKFVFSNRLKPNGSKKSYADLTKPLNKKLDFRKGDKLTKEYVQTEMDKLAEDQEAQKQYMQIMDHAKKLYGGIMCMGGKMYADGGFFGKKKNPNQAEIDAYKLAHPEELDESGNFKTVEDANPLKGTNPKGNFNKPYVDNSKDYSKGLDLLPEEETTFKPNHKDTSLPITKGTSKSFKGSKAIPYAQLLGPASQMITSLAARNKDLANLNYRTPEFTPIDETYAANLAQQGQDRIAATTANAVRGAATDQGTYLAAMLGANSAMLGSPNQPANLAYDAMKTNVAGRNQNAAIKADVANRNIDEREKLLDNSREEFTNSLYNAGATSAGIYRDINQPKQDMVNNDIFTKNHGNIFANLELNPDGTIKVKKSSKFGGKMKKC